MISFRILIAGLVFAVLPAFPLEGGQVDWSSSAFSTHIQSDGTPLDATFIFELGAFADGFVPTAENTALWADYWRVAQRSTYNEANQLFAGSYVVETNASPFGTDAQGYIWGLSAAHPGQWVLMTNPAWTWPAAGGANPPVVWTVRNSQIHILGEVDVTGDPFFLKMAGVDPTTPIPWVTGQDWREARFTAAQIAEGSADWTADPDGDGRTNLVEMGAGGDPLTADKAASLTVSVTSQNTLELTVTKVPNHLLDYFVEVSGDLVNWSHDPSDVDVVTDSASRLIVRDRTRLTGLQRRFIRLTLVVQE